MCRKTIVYLLVVAYLANVGCANLPVPLPGVVQDIGRDLAIRQVAAIWKDDIPIRRTEHTPYPMVERLPGAAFTPTTLPLANMDETTPIAPGDYEIPVHFYCTGLYMRNGSGYLYRLAKLEGKFAEALTQLYVRASKAGTPTSDVQVLSWSMQAGIAYEDLGSQQRALVDQLIPEYGAQMQLGLTEKLMRDWNTWSSRLPVPSFNDALAKMGDIGTYIQTLMRARQEIINKNYNYHALSSVFVTQSDAQAPIEREKTQWSRLHDRIYVRFIAPQGALHDGVIQLRIVDGHSRHQQPFNTTLVTEVRPDRGADGCARSDGGDCTQDAFNGVERLAVPRLAQVAVAGSSGPDNLTPPMITQGGRTAIAGAEDIPDAGPIPAGKLTVPVLGTIGTSEWAQSLTATILQALEEARRDAVKRAAARNSVDANDAALFLGAAALVLGYLASTTPAGAAATLLLRMGGLAGVGGLVEAYLGNRSTELANDPPRDDIDIVSRFEGLTFNLPAPANDLEAQWQAFIMKVVSTGVCLSDLTRSLERVDGALMVKDRRGVQSVPQLPAQTAAVQHNATACAKLLRELSMLMQPTNEAWHTLMDMLKRHQIDPTTFSPQEIRAHFRTLWKEQKPQLRTQLGLSQTDMADLTQAVETGIERVQDPIPRLPDVLLDDEWKRNLESLAQALEQLAVAYATSTPPGQPARRSPPASRR